MPVSASPRIRSLRLLGAMTALSFTWAVPGLAVAEGVPVEPPVTQPAVLPPVQLQPGNRIFIHAPETGGPEGQPMVFRLSNGPTKLEKGAYLGVTASLAQPALRKQLQLPPGVGLVIDFVAEKSPAAEVGLKQADVVQKLDDQVLVNQQQLAVLVRSRKPGDEVKLSVLRNGQPITLTAKLGEKNLPPVDEMRFGEADDPSDRLIGMLPGTDGPFRVQVRALRSPEAGVAPIPWANLMAESVMMSWDDGATNLTFTSKDHQKHLLAKDKEGKVLFDGPVDTQEQRDKMPKELREKMDRIKVIDNADEIRVPAGVVPPQP